MKRFLRVAVLLAVMTLVLGGYNAQQIFAQEATAVPCNISPVEGEAQALTGAGATFPQALYTTWFDFIAGCTGVEINYQAIGSGGGIKAITDGTTEFGASDGPMTDDQMTAAAVTCGGPVLHIAMALGGEVPTYNIPELKAAGVTLKLTPPMLAGIFLGEIQVWNDDKLVADNPNLKDVAQPIAVIHRSDGSGTTNIFTSYLSAISETWAMNVGHGNSVKWPTGIGQKGNAGVAGALVAVPYSIGYVELAFATQNDLPITFLQNKAGSWVQANTETVSNAAAGVSIPEDERIMIVNGDGANTYPIAGFTWILVCPIQKDLAKATALTHMLWWAVHDGQAYNADLGYAPLPAPAVTADEAQIRRIMVNGQPALPQS